MTIPTATPRTLWIGTYPADGEPAGSGEGIWQVTVDADGRFGAPRLVAETPAPSFVALHPSGRTLYAVAEGDAGTVTAFTVSDDGALTTLTDPVTIGSGGSSPCHLHALDDALWIANYMGGVAAVVPLDPETGAFAADTVSAFEGQGAGPRADRQEAPHAHFTGVVGEHALVVDLGADVVRRYPAHGPRPSSAAPDLSSCAKSQDPGAPAPTLPVAATLPPGTGPRHFAALPDGTLVLAGELDEQLHVLTPSGDGLWTAAAATPSTHGDHALRQLAHVTVTDDLVVVGVRGADLLATHRVTPAAAQGSAPTLTPLADVPLSPGAWPRHHAILGRSSDDRLLVVVANQGTIDLAAVLIDTTTGEGAVVDTLAFPTPPSCVLEAS